MEEKNIAIIITLRTSGSLEVPLHGLLALFDLKVSYKGTALDVILDFGNERPECQTWPNNLLLHNHCVKDNLYISKWLNKMLKA